MNFESKWNELKKLFRDYLDVIVKDYHKDRDGDLVLTRRYYGWGEEDFGWTITHDGYVNEFEVVGAEAEEVIDKAINEVKRMINQELENLMI